MAEAETAPLPKITVDEPPPSPPPTRRFKLAKLGDLPMRLIYRGVVGAVVALTVVAAAVVFFVTGWGKATLTVAGGTGPASVDPPVLPTGPSGLLSAPPSDSPMSPTLSASSESETAVPSASPEASSPAGAPGEDQPTATPAPTKGLLIAARADPRLPALPRDRRLATVAGQAAATKGRVEDERSGVSFARFAKEWKRVGSAPFGTRRMLPGGRYPRYRGILVSCPVPIAVQQELKDTAFLAARWTLNYHPADSRITWTASQPIKAGNSEGWLLGYRVHYKIRGKKHVSAAAVALLDVRTAKPALVFITIPDVHKKRWADIKTVLSSVRPL